MVALQQERNERCVHSRYEVSLSLVFKYFGEIPNANCVVKTPYKNR